MKLYTRGGDAGETSLFGGDRVRKDDPRIWAYGEVDELNSAIGLARATPPLDFADQLLEGIQRDLFAIGGQLASPDPEKVKAALEKAQLNDGRVRIMEDAIDAADRELAPLRAFVLPGGTAKAGALHLARTVCRRAERAVVALAREAPMPELFLIYLNRLSDLLFTLARLANHREGRHDTTW
jgi:cob(I)alamin adenosyltransferase